MSLIYSRKDIVETTITVATPLDLVASIDVAVVAAGWKKLGAYANGFEYRLRSPQLLDAKCRVWYPNDPGWPGEIAFQFVSTLSDSIASGVYHVEPRHTAAFGGDPLAFNQVYLWANCCSLFLAQQGAGTNSFLPRSFAGGVPFVPGDVAPTAGGLGAFTTTSECWFAGGDDAGIPVSVSNQQTGYSWRGHFRAQRASFCRNGLAASVQNAGDGVGLQLGILRFAKAFTPGFTFTEWSDGFLQEGDTSPLILNPLVIFGGGIYGVLYDVALASRPSALDAAWKISWHEDGLGGVGAVTDTSWRNYTRDWAGSDEGRLYSLLLLAPSTALRARLQANYVY